VQANALLNAAPALLRWLLVFGIAWTLASTTWFFFAGPQSAGGTPGAVAPGTSSAGPARPPRVSINTIISRNLFGDAAAVAEVAEVAEAAVETRLPLELQGVFVADEPEASAAIVAQRGRAGELYVVGDNLPGNATLIEVHPNYIVLRRAGARETLTFPDSKPQFVAGGSPDDAPEREFSRSLATPFEDDYDEDIPVDETSYDDGGYAAADGSYAGQDTASGSDTMRALVDEYRERINADPEGTLNELGLEPVEADSAAGYRLGALAESPYLSQTGLQPGDVVLSVNGQAVGDVRQDQTQIDSILASGSARLEVQRGNRRFFVTASLNQ